MCCGDGLTACMSLLRWLESTRDPDEQSFCAAGFFLASVSVSVLWRFFFFLIILFPYAERPSSPTRNRPPPPPLTYLLTPTPPNAVRSFSSSPTFSPKTCLSSPLTFFYFYGSASSSKDSRRVVILHTARTHPLAFLLAGSSRLLG